VAALQEASAAALGWPPTASLHRLDGFSGPWERVLLRGRELQPEQPLRDLAAVAARAGGDVIPTVTLVRVALKGDGACRGPAGPGMGLGQGRLGGACGRREERGLRRSARLRGGFALCCLARKGAAAHLCRPSYLPPRLGNRYRTTPHGRDWSLWPRLPVAGRLPLLVARDVVSALVIHPNNATPLPATVRFGCCFQRNP
jgi:hypothetical protein